MDDTFTPTIAQRARLLIAGHPLLATKRGAIVRVGVARYRAVAR